MAQGIAKERELAQHRETTQQAPQGACEQATEQGPLHERLAKHLKQACGISHGQEPRHGDGGRAPHWGHRARPAALD